MPKRVLCLLAAFVIASTAGAGQEKPWHAVRGQALLDIFADRELADGVHYAYQFHRGGLLTGMNMGKPVRGAWRVKGRYLCHHWKRSGNEEECYEVRQNDQEVRLFRDGYEVLSGSLTAIEPPAAKEVQP